MTKVINLFGGAGIGKTTLSAEIFVMMKKERLNCELVREWVKTWAYEQRAIKPFDQFYIAGKQIRQESFLYDRVDYIITDCPLWLGAAYETYYEGTHYIEKHIAGFVEFAESRGVEYYNFLLQRNFAYDTVGRFQNAEQALETDIIMEELLERLKLPFTPLDMKPELRAQFIFNTIMETDAADAILNETMRLREENPLDL